MPLLAFLPAFNVNDCSDVVNPGGNVYTALPTRQKLPDSVTSRVIMHQLTF